MVSELRHFEATLLGSCKNSVCKAKMILCQHAATLQPVVRDRLMPILIGPISAKWNALYHTIGCTREGTLEHEI